MFRSRVAAPRGQLKPSGLIAPWQNALPRGSRLCVPLLDNSYTALGPLARAPANMGSGLRWFPTVAGQGVRANGSSAGSGTHNLTYAAENPNIASVEALIVTGGSVTSKSICGFSGNNVASSSSTSHWLFFNSSSQLTCQVATNGTPNNQNVSDTTTTYALNTLYHVCMTEDGSTMRLYLNGKQMASLTWSGTRLTVTSAHFAIGEGTASNDPSLSLATDMTALYAGYANVCWSPAEVMARAQDVFGYFDAFEWPVIPSLIGGQFHAPSDAFYSWRTK